MPVKRAADVLELLEFFAGRLRPAPAALIAEELGWPRSSTFNLIRTLVQSGYLHEPQARGGFYPTSRWLSLAQAIAEAELLPETLLATVSELAAKTGETIMVGVAAGVHAIMAHVVESKESIRYFAQEGNRLPIHSSATGRAILAQYPVSQRRSLYARISFDRFTPSSLTTPEMVEEEIGRAGERGYHLSIGEFTPHLLGIAIPLCMNHRRMAIALGGPQFRCLDTAPALAAIIRDGVAQLQAAAGGEDRPAPDAPAARPSDDEAAMPQPAPA